VGNLVWFGGFVLYLFVFIDTRGRIDGRWLAYFALGGAIFCLVTLVVRIYRSRFGKTVNFGQLRVGLAVGGKDLRAKEIKKHVRVSRISGGGPFRAHECMFPDAKTDFSDGVYGETVEDLANAERQKVVQSGDLIELSAYGKHQILMYLGRDTFAPEDHFFYPEKPYVGMPNNIIIGHIQGWKKVGHWTSDEWNEMMRAVNEEAKATASTRGEVKS
jgi:hypothetical protein